MDPIGYQEASRKAATIVNNAGIVGQKESAGRLLEEANSTNRGFSVNFERSWSVECHLTLTFESANYGSCGYPVLKPLVQVRWPSTRLSPIQAVAALSLYEDVVKMAALIQVLLDREQVLDKDE